MPDLSLNPDIGTQRAPRVSPYPDASLYLDFLTMSANFMDSRITFSRGTNATLTDSTGRITYAPANLLLRSQEFDNASWAKTNAGASLAPVVTADAGTAPDGTLTADRVQLSLNGGTTSADNTQVRQTISTDSAVTYAFSFWARATDGVSSYNMIVFGAPAAAQPITVTGAWTRFSVVGAGANQNFAFAIRGGQTPTNSNTADILVWGAQLEPVTYQTTPSTYVATTSAAYYGPRFDYDPVTLAPRGLLIEEQRTNLLLRSEEFDNAGWNKTRASITANATTSPDGTVDADKLVEDTTAGDSHFAQQVATVVNATTYTWTVYAKAAERTWLCLYNSNVAKGKFFNLSNGTLGSDFVGAPGSAAITNAGNGWYRCSITFTTTGTTATLIHYLGSADGVAAYTGDGTSGAFIWGAQLEAGAFATSYIPTVASTVTRNADVATMTGTNFSDWYSPSQGTFVVSSDFPKSDNAEPLCVDDGSSANALEVYRASSTKLNGFVRSGNATVADMACSQNLTVGGVYTAALAYAVNDFAFNVGGAAPTTDTAGAVPVGVNIMRIGAYRGGGNQINGCVRTIVFFNTRQPNSQLQTLTT